MTDSSSYTEVESDGASVTPAVKVQS
jgi:hypothetical protein